jgi:hypothetical protein
VAGATGLEPATSWLVGDALVHVSGLLWRYVLPQSFARGLTDFLVPIKERGFSVTAFLVAGVEKKKRAANGPFPLARQT